MFQKASRMKLRFETPQGKLSAEDLWDLPLTSSVGKANLDDIARGLNKLMKSGDDVSFVIKEKKSDEVTTIKFEIVKTIIDIRLAENDAASKARETKEKKQQILGLIAAKEIEKLGSQSIDDLKKMVEAM